GRWFDVVKIWQGGLGIWGAVAGGAIAAMVVAQRRGLDKAALFDMAAPVIPLAQAIGRWGNWFNQELFGRPSTLPWALRIDPGHRIGGLRINDWVSVFVFAAAVGVLVVSGRPKPESASVPAPADPQPLEAEPEPEPPR